MKTDVPLWQKIYQWPEYTAVARAVGYKGITVRDLGPLIEELGKQFGKAKVESAVWHLTVFEGQMRVNPPPLAKVELRPEARRVCHQLLGPPPESPMYARIHEDDPKPQTKEEPKPEAIGKPKPPLKRTAKKKKG